jgi:dienelactone hydrolase
VNTAPAAPASRPAETRRDRRYWVRLLRLALVAVLLTILAVPSGIGALAMWGLTHVGCFHGAPGASPASYGLSYREVDIPTQLGGVFRGYFIPGTNGATIIAPPPITTDRSGMLYETAILARHGYNVLQYEARPCAGKGPGSLGYLEVDDVGDVLTFLKHNGAGLKVDMNRLALHGFSSAGATSIMAAARYPEIQAVVAEGGYHDARTAMGIGAVQGLPDQLILFGARITYRLTTGFDLTVLSPLDAITKTPPRPIFLIYGSIEPSLPGAKAQLAAVRAADPNAPADLWIVPGAWHGGYVSVAAAEYERRVVAFYDCALLAHCEQWNALRQQP